MKKTLYAVPAAAVCFTVLAFLSCAMGGEPAWKADGETVIALTLPSLPSSARGIDAVGSRAVAQGGGYLYVQTGISPADAKTYGPFPATSGEPCWITTIPDGNYPYMALVYAVYYDPYFMASPIIPATATRSGFISEIQSLLADENDLRESSSCTLLTDVDIIPNQINSISATLVPTTSNAPTSTPYLFCTSNVYTRRFIKLTNVSGYFTGAYPGSDNTFQCTVFASTNGTMYAVGLYEEDGSLVAWFPDTRSYTGTSAIYTAPWTGHDVYYMYFEFIDSNSMVNLLISGIVN
jgi:hypothetical protein